MIPITFQLEIATEKDFKTLGLLWSTINDALQFFVTLATQLKRIRLNERYYNADLRSVRTHNYPNKDFDVKFVEGLVRMRWINLLWLDYSVVSIRFRAISNSENTASPINKEHKKYRIVSSTPSRKFIACIYRRSLIGTILRNLKWLLPISFPWLVFCDVTISIDIKLTLDTVRKYYWSDCTIVLA